MFNHSYLLDFLSAPQNPGKRTSLRMKPESHPGSWRSGFLVRSIYRTRKQGYALRSFCSPVKACYS